MASFNIGRLSGRGPGGKRAGRSNCLPEPEPKAGAGSAAEAQEPKPTGPLREEGF